MPWFNNIKPSTSGFDLKIFIESFANSNFQAYDYETIRTALIDYIQNNYPEDYNDWISSSEFIALIDLMAFFGHNLAFKLDLNINKIISKC